MAFISGTADAPVETQTVGSCAQLCEASSTCIGFTYGYDNPYKYQCNKVTDFNYAGARYTPNGIYDTYVGKCPKHTQHRPFLQETDHISCMMAGFRCLSLGAASSLVVGSVYQYCHMLMIAAVLHDGWCTACSPGPSGVSMMPLY